jgi:hypothetical protein
LADLPVLCSVDERDIDFILLEEFHSDATFTTWFVSMAAKQVDSTLQFRGAWHSVSDPKLGESDIILLVRSGSTDTAILIENKIDASAQPDQAQRYTARGNSGTIGADWNRFFTCIVAPAKYLAADTEASSYGGQVSYEAIRDWLVTNTKQTARRDFRIKILNGAIEQNRRGRTRHLDERVATFFRAFWELANAEFPELDMHWSARAAANNTWLEFRPQHLRDLHRKTRFYYKFDACVVDIEFHGLQGRLAELRKRNQPLLTDDVRLIPKGRGTAALSAKAPRMDSTSPFHEQIAQARTALETARKLSSILKHFRIDP